MAKNKFIEKYLDGSKKSGKKKSKSISFDEAILETLLHNSKVLKVSPSLLIEDALKEVGLDKKVVIEDKEKEENAPSLGQPNNNPHTHLS